jgi:hypothetical protein
VTQYTAAGLTEIADHFDTLASDQTAAKRWQQTQKSKRECDIRAEVWRDAAEMLRSTTIVPLEQKRD